LVVQILPDEAQATLAFMKFAKSGAEVALHAAIRQNVPIAGFYGIFGNKISHDDSPVLLIDCRFNSYSNNMLESLSKLLNHFAKKRAMGITACFCSDYKKYSFFSMTYSSEKINDFRIPK